MNPVRPTSSGTKLKKQVKKSKSQHQGQSSMNANSNSNQNDAGPSEKDKGSPVKEFQDYAGISSESIRIYSRQTVQSFFTKKACNLLTEDINYKLRYLIHESLIKSRLQGRDIITADDVDETFADLNVQKVYGAPSSPHWVPFKDNKDTVYQLEDPKVNLIEIAESEVNFSQDGDIVLDQVWLPDGNDSEDDMEECNETFAEYFKTMCEAIISDSEEIRHTALVDISTNPSIGPITDWFYHFSYFLLIKDVTYDRLTMRALRLLEVLENSPLPSLYVYGKQLKLLVRLLLQRILMSTASEDVLKHMSYVLSLFCLRPTLKNTVLCKLEDKLETFSEMTVPLLNIVYYVGIDAVKRIFLPNITYFLSSVYEENDPCMTEVILAIYGLLCKADLNKDMIYEYFKETFSEELSMFYRPKGIQPDIEKKEINDIETRKKLIKTRRKVDYRNRTGKGYTVPTSGVQKVEDVFEVVPHYCSAVQEATQQCKKEYLEGVHFKIKSPCCTLSEKVYNSKQHYDVSKFKREETQITIGKTSLSLSVLKRKVPKLCCDHSLIAWF